MRKPIDGGERRAAGRPRDQLGAVGDRIERACAAAAAAAPAGRRWRRCRAASGAASRSRRRGCSARRSGPRLQRREMARRDVVDMDEIQARCRRTPASGRDAASMMMRPVGVGRTSRGPIGVEGLTITAGKPLRATISATDVLGDDLAALVGADRRRRRQRRVSSASSAVAEIECGDRAGVDDPLDAGAQRLLHDDAACPRHWRGGCRRARAPKAGSRRRRGRDSGRPSAPPRPRRGPADRRPRPRRADRCWFVGSKARTRTRTGWPAVRNSAAIAEPTKPLAPVTRTEPVAGVPVGIGIATLDKDIGEKIAARL